MQHLILERNRELRMYIPIKNWIRRQKVYHSDIYIMRYNNNIVMKCSDVSTHTVVN